MIEKSSLERDSWFGMITMCRWRLTNKITRMTTINVIGWSQIAWAGRSIWNGRSWLTNRSHWNTHMAHIYFARGGSPSNRYRKPPCMDSNGMRRRGGIPTQLCYHSFKKQKHSLDGAPESKLMCLDGLISQSYFVKHVNTHSNIFDQY